MAVMAMPRPDLAAHRESLRLPTTEIVSRLVAILGRKLTAYIGKDSSRLTTLAGIPSPQRPPRCRGRRRLSF